MRDRIMDELGGRSDLSSQIDVCIASAIGIHQNDRFAFSESRTVCTFNTVAAQEFYTSADNAAIAIAVLLRLHHDHYRHYAIRADAPPAGRSRACVNRGAVSVGQPTDYSYYDSKIRLYPVPSAVYAIRVAGHMNIAAPATDSEADNKWMTDAERLIRCRAKFELSLNYGVDYPDLANRMNPDSGAAADAFSELKGTTNKLTGTGRMTPTQF
jgi:hypothetical protein